MPHLVTIRTQIRFPEAVKTACKKLALPAPNKGKPKFFEPKAEWTIVECPIWRFSVVISLTTGALHCNHWNERWGNQSDFHRFTQTYPWEKANPRNSHRRPFDGKTLDQNKNHKQ